MPSASVKGMRLGQGAPRVVVPVMADTLDALHAEVQAALAQGADIVEWRADMASCKDDPAQVAAWCASLHERVGEAPLLFTARTREQGGQASSGALYAQLLERVVKAHACDIVDVELEHADAAQLLALAKRGGMLGLVSHHILGVAPEPAQMVRMFVQMQQLGADVVKLAVGTQCFQDTLRLMAAAGAYANRPDSVPLLGVAMGHEGALSRVLGQSFRSIASFALLKKPSAPGQLSLEQTAAFVGKMDEALCQGRYTELAAINLLRPECKLAVLLGSPVGHSLSPAIHNLSFARAGLDAVYLAAECAPSQLSAALDAFAANPAWVGCNVTMPCKQQAIRHLDGLDDAAMLVGAVNTIAKVGGKLRGYNTDGVGFVASLREAGIDVGGKRVCILGAGGAASAVAAQCALDGAAGVTLAVRADSARQNQAASLLSAIAAEAHCATALANYDDAALMAQAVDASDILVNATPLGMGESAQLPIAARMLRPGLAVADLVYFPQRTPLIQAAQEAGCAVVPGLGMLLHQAAAAERIWLDIDMDVNEVRAQLFA